MQVYLQETLEKFKKWVAEPKLIVNPKSTIASIAKSPQFICKTPDDARTGTVCVPTMEVLKAKSVEEIKSLTLKKMEWNCCSPYIYTLQVKMSDNSEGKAGTNQSLINSVLVDESRIIRKIEVIFYTSENFISKLSFYD
jgi:hypothetical protein